MRVSIFLVVVTSLWSVPVMASDNAGIYFYGTPPSPAQIAALASDAHATTTAKNGVNSIILKWPDVSVKITIDPAWNREVQLTGIRGWLSRFPERDLSSRQVTSFLTKLDSTTTCYGSVISPGYDKAGKVATLLMQLLRPSGGFFFSHQSFYNAKGVRIAGITGDPATLGPKIQSNTLVKNRGVSP